MKIFKISFRRNRKSTASPSPAARQHRGVQPPTITANFRCEWRVENWNSQRSLDSGARIAYAGASP